MCFLYRMLKSTAEKQSEESPEALQSVNAEDFEENIQQEVTEESHYDCVESIESLGKTTLGCVTAGEEEFQQLEIADVTNNDIVIEEIYVDDWMETFQSLESSSSKFVNDAIDGIGILVDQFRYECENHEKNELRY